VQRFGGGEAERGDIRGLRAFADDALPVRVRVPFAGRRGRSRRRDQRVELLADVVARGA
jgi:hypothetical protein